MNVVKAAPSTPKVSIKGLPVKPVVFDGANVGKLGVSRGMGERSAMFTDIKPQDWTDAHWIAFWDNISIAARYFIEVERVPYVKVVLSSLYLRRGRQYRNEWLIQQNNHMVVFDVVDGIEPEIDDYQILLSAAQADCRFVSNDQYRGWGSKIEHHFHNTKLMHWFHTNRVAKQVHFEFHGDRFIPGTIHHDEFLPREPNTGFEYADSGVVDFGNKPEIYDESALWSVATKIVARVPHDLSSYASMPLADLIKDSTEDRIKWSRFGPKNKQFEQDKLERLYQDWIKRGCPAGETWSFPAADGWEHRGMFLTHATHPDLVYGIQFGTKNNRVLRRRIQFYFFQQ